MAALRLMKTLIVGRLQIGVGARRARSPPDVGSVGAGRVRSKESAHVAAFVEMLTAHSVPLVERVVVVMVVQRIVHGAGCGVARTPTRVRTVPGAGCLVQIRTERIVPAVACGVARTAMRSRLVSVPDVACGEDRMGKERVRSVLGVVGCEDRTGQERSVLGVVCGEDRTGKERSVLVVGFVVVRRVRLMVTRSARVGA